MNLHENIQRIKSMMGINEGLHDTSWQNEEGDKVTLVDLLDVTDKVPVVDFPVEYLMDVVLDWNNDPQEVKKIERADLQYPILVLIDEIGNVVSIIDGHHRVQKAIRRGNEFIKAKLITVDNLPENIQKVFSHIGK